MLTISDIEVLAQRHWLSLGGLNLIHEATSALMIQDARTLEAKECDADREERGEHENVRPVRCKIVRAVSRDEVGIHCQKSAKGENDGSSERATSITMSMGWVVCVFKSEIERVNLD